MKVSEETKKLLEQVSERLNRYLSQPWLAKREPYQVVPDVYYVGNQYVGSYLLNTSEGLILIDVAMQETAYLLFESIRKVGFDPADIKKVLITHGHIDHCGAARLVQEYSGCEIYFPEGDAFFLTERRDLIICEQRVPEFQITGYYEYDKEFDFGNIKVKPVHTPGHTPGCTSFLMFADCGAETLCLGMLGGVALNGLSAAELEENRLPLSLQQDYLHSLEDIKKAPVDILTLSHPGHYLPDYAALIPENDGTGTCLRVPGAWEKLLDSRIAEIKALIERDRKQAETCPENS